MPHNQHNKLSKPDTKQRSDAVDVLGFLLCK